MAATAEPTADHTPSSRCARTDGDALRIAVVTETYPPEVNGVSLTLAQVVRGLVQRGHEVQLVRPQQPSDARRHSPRRTPDPGPAPVHETLVRGLPIPLYSHLRMGLPCAGRLARQWRQVRPQVVHVATEGPLGYSAVHAARKLGIPLTSDFRTNFHAYTRHYGLSWLRQPILGYLRSFHNRTAVTMVPTEALRAQLQAAGFRNLTVVSRGVDVGRFDPALRSESLRASWGVAAEGLAVLYVGRLAAEKNLTLLVRSFQAIRMAHPKARLVLVGDGPLRASLQAQLPQAHFAGQRHGADLAAHYASADLFVFPSLTETFGNVTAEAMASGLPVVAFDDAAAAQMITPGVSGAVVARGNETQFERVSVALAGSSAAREAMGTRARLEAARHSWDAVLAGFEAALAKAIGGAGGPASRARADGANGAEVAGAAASFPS